jgi:hypothetical protein
MATTGLRAPELELDLELLLLAKAERVRVSRSPTDEESGRSLAFLRPENDATFQDELSTSQQAHGLRQSGRLPQGTRLPSSSSRSFPMSFLHQLHVHNYQCRCKPPTTTAYINLTNSRNSSPT